MKEIFTAASVEEAKAKAAEGFGVAEEKISFAVIEEPKKGLFGKIKGEAKVEAEYNPPTKTEVAVQYISDILEKMGIENATVEATEAENGVNIEIGGDGFEELLGKKGELLDSIQYLSSLVCNKIDREYFRITIDCNGFRERRKEQLEKLAGKIANGVKKNGRTTALEPMNPYERRIIHAAVSEIEGVTSKSVGEEPYRKVIISSTEKRPYKGGYKGKGNGRKGGRHGKPKPHYDITTSFEKDYKKPKPEDELDLGSGLYGKIEF
jgi:spoIIIJ-associated protein